MAKNIEKAKQISPSRFLLCTSNMFRINEDRINRYLVNYDITAKDIRGYSSNKWIVNRLKEIEPAETEAKRQKQFNIIAKKVAEKVGHGYATLKKHYMLPRLESEFVKKATIIEMKKMGGRI